MKTLGDRLKKAREEKRYTQMDVAQKLGITNGALSGYERNYREPDIATIKKLAELYGVSVQWLLTGDDSIDFPNEDYTAALLGFDERKRRILEWLKDFTDEEVEHMLRTAELIHKAKVNDEKK